MALLSEDKRIITYPSMNAQPGITCFTTTRHGGCSEGNYGSFNCGPHTADDPGRVRQNLQTLQDTLPQRPRLLAIPHQTHGTGALVVDEAFVAADEAERTALLEGKDILLTNLPGVCVAVTTADCIPLAFYDKTHRAVAVVHAGWRGTILHVVRTALENMSQAFGTRPEDLTGVMGPGISMAGFEVDDEVRLAFAKAGFPIDQVSERTPYSRKCRINLWVANRMDMEDFGMKPAQIEMSGICTYLQYARYFSARRLGHDSGRMLTGIMING